LGILGCCHRGRATGVNLPVCSFGSARGSVTYPLGLQPFPHHRQTCKWVTLPPLPTSSLGMEQQSSAAQVSKYAASIYAYTDTNHLTTSSVMLIQRDECDSCTEYASPPRATLACSPVTRSLSQYATFLSFLVP